MNIMNELKKIFTGDDDVKTLSDAKVSIINEMAKKYEWGYEYKAGEVETCFAYAWERVNALNKSNARFDNGKHGDAEGGNAHIICRGNFNSNDYSSANPTGWFILRHVKEGSEQGLYLYKAANCTFKSNGIESTPDIYRNPNFATFKTLIDDCILTAMEQVNSFNNFCTEKIRIESEIDTQIEILKSLKKIKIDSLMNITNFKISMGNDDVSI